MKIDDQLILKLEDLAKLNLTETERLAIKKDLEKIFTMFEKLREVNTDDVDPFIHFSQLNEIRKDVAGENLSNDSALSNAPREHTPYFIVPKIIE